MHVYLGAAAALFFYATALFAADEYFVVQDPATKNCKTTNNKPDGQTFIMIGTTSYKTNAEANKECRGRMPIAEVLTCRADSKAL
jgi:hypothetical protein